MGFPTPPHPYLRHKELVKTGFAAHLDSGTLGEAAKLGSPGVYTQTRLFLLCFELDTYFPMCACISSMYAHVCSRHPPHVCTGAFLGAFFLTLLTQEAFSLPAHALGRWQGNW